MCVLTVIAMGCVSAALVKLASKTRGQFVIFDTHMLFSDFKSGNFSISCYPLAYTEIWTNNTYFLLITTDATCSQFCIYPFVFYPNSAINHLFYLIIYYVAVNAYLKKCTVYKGQFKDCIPVTLSSTRPHYIYCPMFYCTPPVKLKVSEKCWNWYWQDRMVDQYLSEQSHIGFRLLNWLQMQQP